MKIELKKFDYIIIGIVSLFLVIGAVLFIGKTKIAKTPVISEDTIVFQVFFRGVTITSAQNPFVPTEDSFITIRNVPHKNVTIVGARMMPKMALLSDSSGNVRLVKDVASPYMYDCLVSLVDDAKITDDGAVLGGNKLKIGLPIVLEGKNYRFNGTVTNITVLTKEQAEEVKAAVAQERENRKKLQANPMNLPDGLTPEHNSVQQVEPEPEKADTLIPPKKTETPMQ